MEAAHSQDDSTDEAESDADFHLAVYEASHNLVMLHIMRSLSDMLRKDVFYNRAKLYQRQGVRELLLEQHRAVYQTVMAGDPDAAKAAAEAHIDFTRELRLEVSLAASPAPTSSRRSSRELGRFHISSYPEERLLARLKNGRTKVTSRPRDGPSGPPHGELD
jgi:GntR family transcriptional repressor for pyruvate dehydrogenase complex